MATRAIKKLTKKDDLLELKKKNQELELNESDDDEEDADVEFNFKPKYAFNLVRNSGITYKIKSKALLSIVPLNFRI